MDDFESIEEAINVIDDVLRNGNEVPLNDTDKKIIASGKKLNTKIY